MSKTPTNFPEQFQAELNRMREIQQVYMEIPIQSSWFARRVVAAVIEAAEKALRENDVVAMIAVYKEMTEMQ